MATEYSHTQFVGIDKLPLFPQDIRPANVTFKEADVLAGLPFEDNSFDLIQMRLFLVTFNRTQYIESLNEIYRLLKPGGFIQLVEPQLMDQGDDFIKEYTSKLKIIMEYNDYDSEVSDHLSILLDKTRFITKEILRKGVPLGKLKKKKKYILTGQCRKSSTFKRISIYST
jgi:ubiquinone/menaquinone biosynthesis C-methylase UbiE